MYMLWASSNVMGCHDYFIFIFVLANKILKGVNA